jgi:hypothetical protein
MDDQPQKDLPDTFERQKVQRAILRMLDAKLYGINSDTQRHLALQSVIDCERLTRYRDKHKLFHVYDVARLQHVIGSLTNHIRKDIEFKKGGESS